MIRRGTRSTFTQIADDLRRRIRSGEFEPGSKLPPMRVLAAEYEVAGATLDKAVDLLKGERLVEGRTGSGTFVLERPAELWTSSSLPFLRARPRGARDAWSEETAAKGRVGTQRLVGVEEAEPPSSVSEALGLQAGEVAVVRRRLVSLDGVPIELADSFYPVHVARGTPLAEARRIKGGAVTALAELGYVASDVGEEVASRMPTDGERELLTMDTNVPVLILRRVVVSPKGEAFEVTVMTMPADRRRLTYAMKLG